MPYHTLKDLRQQGPVLKFDDPLTGVPCWTILGVQEMDFVCKHPELFSSAMRTAYPMEFPQDVVDHIHNHLIFNMDPPRHQKMRRVVREAFTPKQLDSYAPAFKLHAKQILDRVAAKGECEFIEEVAAELPLVAILELLGVPLEDRKQFFNWTNTMIFADDSDMAISAVEAQIAAGECINYALKLAAQQRINPMNNITGALLDGEIDGIPVS
jgi:cholest-4-en-3-one 26-monooxygenase